LDVRLIIKNRLEQLGLDQKDLAAAVGVTDAYISQLLTRKKLPPAPERTDIYVRMAKVLKLPANRLSELAGHERVEELKKRLPDAPAPLFRDVRELILQKCSSAKREEIRAIFEKQPFGELERLVTQKLLDVAKKVAKEELESESWLKVIAQLTGRTYQEVRGSILQFLKTDVLRISAENCVSFLDPLIDAWDIDLANFGMEIVLNRRLTSAYLRKVDYVESDGPREEEPGLKEFLQNAAMSGDLSQEETTFLRDLKFKKARPTALYYYRELQNLRDPLNFREASVAPLHKYGDAASIERQMQLHSREDAIERWSQTKPSRASRSSKSHRRIR